MKQRIWQCMGIYLTRNIRKILVLLCVACSPLMLAALDAVNNLSFDFYSQEQGLSNNQIHCVLQDKKGWIWIGTSQGVCRFDGYRFTVFKNNPDDPSSLKGNLVRTIFEDHKGQLWIGTESGGLNKFDREKENFQQFFYHGEQSQLKNVSITAIQEDAKNTLWIGTENRLYSLENETKLTAISPSNLSSFSEYFRVVRFGSSGEMWLGTNTGIFRYDPATNTCEKKRLDASSSNQEVWEILQEEDGSIWIGTYANCIYRLDIRSGSIKQIIIDPENDRCRTVRAICKAPNNRYWIGTRGGLYLYDKTSGIAGKYYHDDREPRSLVNNSILCISKDSRGNIWIGTRH